MSLTMTESSRWVSRGYFEFVADFDDGVEVFAVSEGWRDFEAEVAERFGQLCLEKPDVREAFSDA